jgi:CelD/BcsL family acetyltransferase involved in cellulose biosynthesis
VPLVRADQARECLTAFFNWLESAESSSLMEFTGIAGEGSFYELLIEEIRARRRATCLDGHYKRGLLRRATDADQYLQSTISAVRRKKLRRQQRRLSETGTLEYPALAREGNVDRWIEEFLRLEASGWKGKEKSAMNCRDADHKFFEAIAKSAFEKGRLSMIAIHLDGQPIASQCNFLAGSGAFAFKTAFDERYARFSPGVLLEVEHIRRLHDDSSFEWMDSCCGRPDTYFDSLCNDRKTVLTVVVATKRAPGALVISMLPLLRWINRRIQKRSAR